MYRQKKRCRALWISITLVLIFTSILFQPVNAQTQVYEKVDPNEIVSGQYIMVASNGYAPTTLDGSWLLSEKLYEPPEAPDILTDVNSSFLWALDFTEGQVQLTDSSNNSIAPNGGDNNGIKKGNYSWLFVDNEDGTVSFKGRGNDTVTLASNNGADSKFRAYKNKTTSDNPAGFPSTFTLYRPQEQAAAYKKIHGNELISGAYVMVLDNGYAPTNYNNSWVYSKDLGILPSEKPYLTPSDDLSNAIWTIELLNNGTVRLKDSQGVYIAPKNGDNNQLIQGRFDWDVTVNENGTISFWAEKNDTRVRLAANMTANTDYFGRFRAYQAKAIDSQPGTYPLQFTLYQVPGSIETGTAIPPIYIYEAYGGGGNKDAIWKNDYVILINRGEEAVLLDGYYLHYASATGSFSINNQTALSGEIEANDYYVIQQASGDNKDAKALPYYDVEDSIAMSASAFKLALTYDNTPLNTKDDENIIDFLGVGNNASPFWGTGPAPTLSNTKSLQRKDYNKDNSTDYQVIQADGNNLDYLTVPGPTPLLQPLEFIEVPTDSWSRGDAELTFRLNGGSENLISVSVNGDILNESNYSVESGSTILTLLASYLEDLTPGTHNLMANFNAGEAVAGGEVETSFEIATPNEPPSTTPTGPGQTEPTTPNETEPTVPETSQPIPTEPTTPTMPEPTEPGEEGPQPPETVSPETEVVPTGESIYWMLYGLFFILAASLVLLISQKAIRKADKTP